MGYLKLMQEVQGSRFLKTICSNRMEHPRIEVMSSVLFLTHFSYSWIGRLDPYNWPAGSPYLSPPDFLLWVFVKDEVFRTPARNIKQFKRIITRAIRSIQQETLQKVWKN